MAEDNRHAISTNQAILTQTRLNVGDYLNVQTKDDGIIFTKKGLKDEIQAFYHNGGQYNENEIGFGEAQGKEVNPTS